MPKWAICDDLGKLVLRVGIGLAMIPHGIDKWNTFDGKAAMMDGMLGLPGKINAGLTVFSELGCSVLLVIGLLTRLASLPLLFTMGVAISFHIGKGDGFLRGWESAGVYFVAYAAILCLGPGKFSLDHLLFGRRKRS